MANPAIDQFWAWWPEGRAELQAALERQEPTQVVETITARVKAIHPGLAWEIGPGKRARHSLCVTAEGDPALRPTTERWRLAGPEPDETWEYHPARQPIDAVDKIELSIGPHKLRFAELRFDLTVRDSDRLVDVRVLSPDFKRVSDDDRMRMAFIALDNILGEDDVARWCGAIASDTPSRKDAAVPVDGLREVIASVAQRLAEPTWTVAKLGPDSALPGIRLSQNAKRIDHPLLDQWLCVTNPYAAAPNGMPLPEANESLKKVDQALERVMEGNGVDIVRQTRNGERRQTFYVDSDGPMVENLRAMFTAMPAMPGLGTPRITTELDPAWAKRRHI